MKYTRKAVTVEAIELLHPIAITTPKGILKGQVGDYFVALKGQQFIVPKDVFLATYQLESEPDTTEPMEVTNLTVGTITDTSIEASFSLPYDADFNHINVYIDGVFATFEHITPASILVKGLTASTTYTLLITTVDNSGNESTGVNVTVTTNGAAN